MRKLNIPQVTQEEIKRIRDSILAAKEVFFVPVGRTAVSIIPSDIVWIESAANYAKIHTYNRDILSLFSIKDLINKLPSDKFVRISRSTIVNIQWISWFDKEQVVLLNGIALGFGEDGKKRLIESIILF